MMLALAAAISGAQAQDGAPSMPGGPLDLRPTARAAAPAKAARPAVKPAASKPAAADAASPRPAPNVASKQKPKSKSAKTVAAKAPAPQASELAAASPTGPTKPLPVVEKAPEKIAAPEPAPKPVAEVRPPFDEYVITQFCTSLSSAASDGRLAWQAKRIEEMEGRLRDRIAELDAKRAETAEWLKRREEALKKADETVVAIYSKMKPDAAAAQFSAMDESGAAAILSKLPPRQAGIVLNEIDAARAARIAAEMAGVGQRREVARSVAP